MKQLNFSNEDLAMEGLKELKGMFIQDMQKATQYIIQSLMNQWMEIERDEFIEQVLLDNEGANRPDYRNGYYERTLRSPIGAIDNLRVPRTRSSQFYPSVLEKAKHISSFTAEGITRMYLRGVSTHHVGEVLEGLLGYRVSSSYVSQVTKTLDRDVQIFYKRKIESPVKFLFLDGIYIKSKGLLKSRKRPILVAYGIYEDGRREFLHFRIAKNESENEWLKMINELYKKGLTEAYLEGICTDGCPGLITALEAIYPYTKRMRCWAHKMRNVANKCKKSQWEECKHDAQQICYASSKKEAVRQFKVFKSKWSKDNPKGVECIEKDLEELLNFYDFDSILWKKIRTTNVIERAFGEIRRRTKVMGSFPNDDSCARMVYALFSYFNTKWAQKRFYIQCSVLKKVA